MRPGPSQSCVQRQPLEFLGRELKSLNYQVVHRQRHDINALRSPRKMERTDRIASEIVAHGTQKLGQLIRVLHVRRRLMTFAFVSLTIEARYV